MCAFSARLVFELLTEDGRGLVGEAVDARG